MYSDQEKYEESKLVSLLAEGSEYAFQLIYDRHRKRIYQVAFSYLKSPILAQEVVQDVFLKLWYHRENLDPGLPVEGWLYSIAKNNILNRIKKIANEWKALKGFGSQSEKCINNNEDRMLDSQYSKLLEQAIAQLPEQQKNVFILARNEDMTYTEIAEKMNISPLTVKTHMSRALSSIKSFFAENGIIISTTIFLLLF